MSSLDDIKRLLADLGPEDRREIFDRLRDEFPLHPLEQRLNAKAELILEAIARSPDITLRGVRGIIAEAAFSIDVLPTLTGWKDTTPPGQYPFDCLLEDANGRVSVQIKLQRLENHEPLRAKEGDDLFVVETQRTRTGTDAKGGKTRPYRYGEFDILAVCLHPSTQKWTDFVYTVGLWLLPHPREESCLRTFQPVNPLGEENWTRDFNRCVEWFRSGEQRRICSGRMAAHPRKKKLVELPL
jgi:hypothetical protein